MQPTAYKIGEWERKWLSKDMQKIIVAYQEENNRLEEENETLRDTNGDLQRWLKQTEDMFKFQQEENKKLKEYNWELIENHKKDIAILCEENKKLKEEIRFLEQCLDNKEKVNKSLREELQEWLNAVWNK